MIQTRQTDLSEPSLYINRELSLLEFNRRVLEQAKDRGTPLLERLRFLTICSTNLDEFFEIRVAGLKEQVAYGIEQAGQDGLTPQETLRRISETARELVAEQYRVLNDDLLPALAKEGIELSRRQGWSARQRRWIERTFRRDVLPVLTPIGIDPAHPFPRVLNKGLTFLVTVEGQDAFQRDSGVAVVTVPRALPRVLRMPDEVSDVQHSFVMLSSIVHEHVDELFPGMRVTGCSQFRVTRNSDLWVDEEEIENLLQALKGELPRRKYGAAVRLEVADNCTDSMAAFLAQNVDLSEADVYRVDGPVNLNRLATIHALVERPDLKYPPFVPGTRRRLKHAPSMFEAITRGDVLLHHPYESFTPVVKFLQEAAADPDVVAIKQTVYRTDHDSPLVQALHDAAQAGKEVTAVVELRARFEEAQNIALATRLQAAGANVVYGVVGYKAHAKLLLVVRREGARLKRYVHVGTGNYHPGTARAYTDFGLLSDDRQLGLDVHKLFQQLTGLGKAGRLELMLQSPFTLHKQLLKRIDAEARAARAGRPARILARMNSLSEPRTIQALYAASQAGVRIDLVVRGICCLRPGVPGVSDNIRVRSIVGRFLEHSRVYYFYADGQEEVFCASADWMSRNLFKRVEAAFPVTDQRLSARVLYEGLEVCLKDNQQAWELGADGSYSRARPGKQKPFSSQEVLLEILADAKPGERARRHPTTRLDEEPELVVLRGAPGAPGAPESGEEQDDAAGDGDRRRAGTQPARARRRGPRRKT